jgi:hypothetical protein
MAIMASRGEGGVIAKLKKESEALRTQLDEAHSAIEVRAVSIPIQVRMGFKSGAILSCL